MKKTLLMLTLLGSMINCVDRGEKEDSTRINFAEVSQIDLGGKGAAEISTFDPTTKQLFVVNNDGPTKVDIIDFSDPSNLFRSLQFDVYR